ncbi:hypothetical protein LLE49_12305 [Alicyclobacillus tolerans]|uniref:hypothetical protein n=1 Tax=Alicyclobacillus tolerans TaxID=90970 RepID=UPI001F1F326A|nr:hypothetical protein [Alicyclobacillus tolerans]MCF8565499.1 hypothetical protein [Alicyclobacillus tolerans]
MSMDFRNQEHQENLRKAALEIDKSDLLAILELRFGSVSTEVVSHVQSITEVAILERLILVAANVPDLESLHGELTSGGTPFGIVGESFNPIPTPAKGTC